MIVLLIYIIYAVRLCQIVWGEVQDSKVSFIGHALRGAL